MEAYVESLEIGANQNIHGASYFEFNSPESSNSSVTDDAALSWGGQTHTTISKQAFDILWNKTNEGVYKYQTVYAYSLAGYPSNYTTNGFNIIPYFAKATDSIEKGPKTLLINRYAGHFYDPDVRDSYMPGTSYKNAYRNFNDHYFNATMQWNSGQKKEGYKALGMSMHYLEDLNTPHHAANKIVGKSNHPVYEDLVNYELKYNGGSYLEWYAGNETYNYVCNSRFIDMAKSWSSLAKQQYNSCANYYAGAPSYLADSTLAATRPVLSTAQRAAAGLLYRYLKNTYQI